jgi:uncharacterized protein
VAVRDDHRGSKAGPVLNLYLDSSAGFKLVIREPETDEVRALWDEADSVTCLSLGYVEMRSAIGRRVGRRTAVHAWSRLDQRWQRIETLDVDDGLIALAVRAADTHGLRTLDALHLAAALSMRRTEVVVVSYDAELRRASELEGFAVAP